MGKSNWILAALLSLSAVAANAQDSEAELKAVKARLERAERATETGFAVYDIYGDELKLGSKNAAFSAQMTKKALAVLGEDSILAFYQRYAKRTQFSREQNAPECEPQSDVQFSLKSSFWTGGESLEKTVRRLAVYGLADFAKINPTYGRPDLGAIYSVTTMFRCKISACSGHLIEVTRQTYQGSSEDIDLADVKIRHDRLCGSE